VEALGPNSQAFSKKLLSPLMENMADKSYLFRPDTVKVMDRWAIECGAELVITLGTKMLS
jgi:hypothetical protein